jgi:hypothetical protein
MRFLTTKDGRNTKDKINFTTRLRQPYAALRAMQGRGYERAGKVTGTAEALNI